MRRANTEVVSRSVETLRPLDQQQQEEQQQQQEQHISFKTSLEADARQIEVIKHDERLLFVLN